MIGERLRGSATLPGAVREPAYVRSQLQPGILHIGLGAFHRAHQVVYTDAALSAEFAPWGIEAVSLRSTATAHALAEQDGLYSTLADFFHRTHDLELGYFIDSIDVIDAFGAV